MVVCSDFCRETVISCAVGLTSGSSNDVLSDFKTFSERKGSIEDGPRGERF